MALVDEPERDRRVQRARDHAPQVLEVVPRHVLAVHRHQDVAHLDLPGLVRGAARIHLLHKHLERRRALYDALREQHAHPVHARAVRRRRRRRRVARRVVAGHRVRR